MTGLPLSRIYVIRAVLFNGLDCGIHVNSFEGTTPCGSLAKCGTNHICLSHLARVKASMSLCVNPYPQAELERYTYTPLRSTPAFQMHSSICQVHLMQMKAVTACKVLINKANIALPSHKLYFRQRSSE